MRNSKLLVKFEDNLEEIEIGNKSTLAGCNTLLCSAGLLCATCLGCTACIFPPALSIAFGASGGTVLTATVASALAVAAASYCD